jgi:uncharacterized membrane protein HdeD (DUF308 family)
VTAVNTPAPTLRRLYLARFGFAVVWAGLLLLVGTPFGLAAAVLVVLYPLVDAAAAVVDLRGSRSRELVANAVVSLVVAVGLGFAATSGVPAVLRVWGAWAIVAGALQLVVALRRRGLGGQWPMILSGGLSVLVGVGFVLSAAAPDATLTNIAGYAALGGVFFLVSALRMR